MYSNMHGPIPVPRIIEPIALSNSRNQITQYFPGDGYTTFQTTITTPVVASANHLTIPHAFNPSVWNPSTATKVGPPLRFQRKYPSVTFTQAPSARPTIRPRFFRAPGMNGLRGVPLLTGFRSTNSSPPAPPLQISDLAHPFLLVSQDHHRSGFNQRRHSMPGTSFGISPYFVDLHVGPNSAVQVHNGPETHIIQGPASVTIMSNCTNPPTAIPVTVPPGQYVQQLIDDHGVLRSVYITNQPFTEGSHDTYQHSYYVPAQIQLQMPIHANNAQFPVPHLIPVQANGMQQNGFPPVPPSAYPQDFHAYNHHQAAGVALDDRAYAARMKLKKKYNEKKQRPTSTPYYGNGNNNRRYPETDSENTHEETTSVVANGTGDSASGGGDADIDHHKECESVSPPTTVNGVESEEHVLAEFFSTIQPVTVDNILANSVTITCTPLDTSKLDYSLLEHTDIKETEWEYFVCCGEASDKQRTFTAGTFPQLTMQLVELKPNTEYQISAQVGYELIRGRQSETVTFRTAKAPPDPPEPPRLQGRLKNSLAIKWLASRCDNGAKILRYIVEYDQGQGDSSSWTECYRGLEKQTKVLRLQNTTTYRFRIFAENEVGLSAPSQEVAFSTAGLPPTQPEPPRVIEVSAHHIVFEWSRRACDDSFVLQLEDPASGHGFLNAYAGHDTFCSCKELTRVTDYKVRLCAENGEGSSQYSNVISVTTLSDPPGAPSKPFVKGKVLSTSFRVHWDPPVDTGGEPIAEYFSECTGTDNFKFQHVDSENNVLVTGAEPGQHYFFRVHARNSAGAGPYSEVCMIHTPPVAPGAPVAPYLVGKAKPTAVFLRWDTPKYTGGEHIASYELKKIIQYDGFNLENDGVVVYYGNLKENHVEGLSPGKTYLFAVRAYNSIGPGPWSPVAQIETDAGPPDAPESLRLQAQNSGSILAAWKEPWSNGAPVTEFRLEMSDDSDEKNFTPVYTGPKFNYEIKNLKPNTEYFFRLSAHNLAGHGPFSPPHSCWTPPACPGSIQTDTVQYLVSPTAITLSWSVPEDNGSAVTGYKVEFEHQLRVVDNPIPQCLLDGLQPDTVYKIRIQASNSIGDGPLSQAIKIKTRPVVPDIPKLEIVTVSHNSIKVKWTNVAKNSVEVDYVLEMAFNKKDVFQTVYRGNQTAHKLNKVREETIYFFRVHSVNEAGSSPPSDIAECRTPKAPPPAVKAPKVTPCDDCCQIQWAKLPQSEGEDISYILQVSRANGTFVEVYKGPENQFKHSKLEPGICYQFRVKPIRVLSDARSIPGSWSPLAMYTLPLASSTLVTNSKSCSASEDKITPSKKSFRQHLKIDFGDERVAIILAGFCILICVVLVSSYILLSN